MSATVTKTPIRKILPKHVRILAQSTATQYKNPLYDDTSLHRTRTNEEQSASNE